MNHKISPLILTVAILLSSCTNNSSSNISYAGFSAVSESNTTQQVSMSDPHTSNEEVKTVLVEEETSESSTTVGVENNAISSEMRLPEIPQPYPAMPTADESAMADSKLKAELIKTLENADTLLKMLDGHSTPVKEIFPAEQIPLDDEVIEYMQMAEGAYWTVDDSIPDKAALTTMYTDVFTENYFSTMETPLDELLFGDSVYLHKDEKSGEIMLPMYMTVDGKLLVYQNYMGVPVKYRFSEPVISYADESTAEVCVAGTCLSFDNWYMMNVSLVKHEEKWMIDKLETKEANHAGGWFEKLINNGNMKLLEKICGNCEYIEDSDGTRRFEIFNDKHCYQVENFMTIDEMKAFLKSIFTEDLAEWYISNYVGRFYQQNGNELYIEQYINPETIGSFDIVNSSCCFASYYPNGGFLIICSVPWYVGDEKRDVLIRIKNTENGIRISEKLPSSYFTQIQE